MLWRHTKHEAKKVSKRFENAARALLEDPNNPGARPTSKSLMHGEGMLKSALDQSVFDEKLPPLVRCIAAINNAADLKNALQLIMVESAQTYTKAYDKGNLSVAVAALKTAGWTAVVLGKAHGWIKSDPTIVDQRSVNLFGDLGPDAMRELKIVLEGATRELGHPALPLPRDVTPPKTEHTIEHAAQNGNGQLEGQLDFAADLMATVRTATHDEVEAFGAGGVQIDEDEPADVWA